MDAVAATAAVAAVCPELVASGVLHRSGKALLLEGTLHGRSVVAKLLTLNEDFWRAAFTREVRAYTAFTATPPPVTVPALHAADTDLGLLVIDRVDGSPAAGDRYPTPALSAAAVADILGSIAALRRWQPPAELREQVFDYPSRFRRYHTGGFLDAADVAALHGLLARTGDRWEFAHGDLIPTNVRIPSDPATAGPVLIDWEFAGLYRPGFDLALQWVLLGRTPGLRNRIEHQVAVDPAAEAGFWINVACVMTRELRIHRELPDGAARTDRLTDLDAVWTAARRQIRELARRGG